ncbi:hypothetical protein CYQ61_11240 [Enterococcus faecium]|uniref:RepB family plasmid replication initiator protein n=14 Tax=Bacillota TaxID=1239 RepID=UPI00100F4D63|nr:RepB family plasmid replication initiator protein [Enterococcus faecium]RXW70140.1 hypothetical protein CYQ68_10880 [Enterococcus faecium]RXW87462.1 hypothetical protein CYQ61_11240 [Enterococcus faecium]
MDEKTELTVKYQNELNLVPLKNFNAKQMDLFFALCARMKDRGLKKVRFSFEELKELSDYKMTATKAFVGDLEKLYKDMLNLTYRTEDEDSIRYFVLFTGFEINKTKKKIGKREGNQENFINNIKKFIVHLLEAVPTDIEKLSFADYPVQKEKESEKSIVGKCPKCGNNIVLKKSFYGCSNYPQCKFTLAEHFRKKKLTKTNVKELLEGKETLVKGIKNKEKKPYNAVVKIGEKGYIDFISFSK